MTGRPADGWISFYGSAPPDEVTVLRDRVPAAARDAAATRRSGGRLTVKRSALVLAAHRGSVRSCTLAFVP